MRDFLALGKKLHDMLDVVLRQLIAVRDLHALLGGVDEQSGAVRLATAQDEDIRGDGRAEKQVVRQLDDTVRISVVDEVLPNLLLGTAPVHDAGEADDSCRAVGRPPRQAVHDKGHIRLRLGEPVHQREKNEGH